jgi:hypothetical protein
MRWRISRARSRFDHRPYAAGLPQPAQQHAGNDPRERPVRGQHSRREPGNGGRAFPLVSPHRQFAGLNVQRGDRGVPLLADPLTYCECRVAESVVAGTHRVFPPDVTRAVAREGSPLTYYVRCKFGRFEVEKDRTVYRGLPQRILSRAITLKELDRRPHPGPAAGRAAGHGLPRRDQAGRGWGLLHPTRNAVMPSNRWPPTQGELTLRGVTWPTAPTW